MRHTAGGPLDTDEPGVAGRGPGHGELLQWEGHLTRARAAGGAAVAQDANRGGGAGQRQ